MAGRRQPRGGRTRCVSSFVWLGFQDARRLPNSRVCQNESGGCDKALKTMERVKGIEPSYSAWKAAALPLSYTRARPINYHGKDAASTAKRRFGPLTSAESLPILTFPSTTKGGDPVSFTKRCHLAGIAR
jgi:hypothetical protein